MIKTILDKTLALLLIIVFIPFYIIVSLAILVKMGRPILFKQNRPGLHGEIFSIYKFRTMNNNAHLPDEQRIGSTGKFIRSTSLDELPQLFNVLKGEMSFVGPRPLLVEYLELYSDEHKKRHDVKPGITGWAQVNGRNAISWEQKFTYDVWYVKNHNLILDIKILFLTAKKVFIKEGVSAEGHATIEDFKGIPVMGSK